MNPETTKLLITGVLFVAALRAGVFAWAKLGKHAKVVLYPVSLLSMAVLLPYIHLETVFDPSVFPSFLVLHICGGTIVCSVIAKWVEDKARKDIERENSAQIGE